jgi:putative PIN family toxin of toxin-antitoxin system
VVLDTNVVLSALIFSHGRLARLRQAWRGSLCQPLVSTATAAELMRALNYPKFKLSAEDQQELLADYLPYCIAIAMPTSLPEAPACRDPLDLPFLRLAMVGKADYLVSGDQDLLSLAGGFACRIVTAGHLLSTVLAMD